MIVNRRDFMKVTGLMGGGIAFVGIREAIGVDPRRESLTRASILPTTFADRPLVTPGAPAVR
jgi:hypothetical protein